MAIDFGPFKLVGTPPPADGAQYGYAPRRTVLDKILVDAAIASGVELREHFSVQELLTDGDRVTGIRGQAHGGGDVTEDAQIVVGADGLHSVVARLVHAPTYNEVPSLTCAYYTYWSDLPVDGVELYSLPNRFIVVGGTNDGQTVVQIFWPHASFQEVRSDVEGSFAKTLDLVPLLAERARAGRRSERFRGTGDLPNFYRKPYGPGWALVGDAGYHKDPNTAYGITDAFRDAGLLTEAIDAGLAGRQPLDGALAEYERQRNSASQPLYEMTCQFGSLQPPPPEMQRILGALPGNKEQTNRFFGVFSRHGTGSRVLFAGEHRKNPREGSQQRDRTS